MSQQTDPPAVTPPPQPEPPFAALARKLTLLVLLTLAVSLGLTVLAQYYWDKSPLLTFLLANIGLALVSGLSVRWVLRGQSTLVRILITLGILASGLALLGFLTAGRIGISPWRAAGASWFKWLDFGQLLLGVGASLLCLFAWQSPAAVASATDGSSIRTGSAAAPSTDTLPVNPKHKRPLRRKSNLHLSDTQEHRCPYCLELVEPDDPRGVVECKICHTLHHGDCWAITGACQVPHYTS